ncbi:MAG: alpha/beta hydrolase [Deltaproteobacteria bacterium]|nr:alpha/beta hydrolase [Deltaproteobacteria bacterium]
MNFSMRTKLTLPLLAVLASGVLALSSSFASAGSSVGIFETDFQAQISADPETRQDRLQAFVKIHDNRELFVDFIKPAAGKPIVVLLNGLTYRTGVWDAFVKELKGDGLGILRYDPMGHGKTMVKYGYPAEAFEADDQVKDLNSLLSALSIKKPVHLLGLSYGGAIGTMFTVKYPKKVASLILMAPFTKPLESQDQQIRLQIAQTRFMFPFNRSSDDELYDFFLKQIVYATYPLAEPIVLEHPYKLESTFRLVQGVRKFKAADVADQLPDASVHLIVADKDQYIEPKILEELWKQIPKRARLSRLFINHSEHKIPEAMPNFSAEWIKLIVNGDQRIQDGRTWKGGTFLGYAASGTEKIEIE